MAHEKFIKSLETAIEGVRKKNPKGRLENFHTNREKRAYIQGYNTALNIVLMIINQERNPNRGR